MSAKAALRVDALKRRTSMSEGRRTAAGTALAAALADLLGDARRVAAYVSIGTEPPTGAVLAARPDALVPVLLPDGDLDWSTGPSIPTSRGLLEPTGRLLGVDAIASCDLVLVPALAVDRSGTRLGRGGGSYDRALRRATGLTIAMLYDGELVDALPAEPHDVAVSAVVTPSGGVVRL